MSNEFVKLVDFASSQKFNPEKRMTQILGTAYYIAPEVLAGSYTHLCDIWSIGVILYLMISGKPPFDGKNE